MILSGTRWSQPKRDPHLVLQVSDFYKILPSLTTSEEGLKRHNITIASLNQDMLIFQNV